MEKIRTAVIGYSRRGKNLVRRILEQEDFELVCVCDRDGERLTEAEAAFGSGVRLEQDFSEAAGRDDIDAVVVATPQFSHRDLTVEAFGHGKHVFCEKPLACTVRECDDMIAAAKEANRVFIVGQQMRYHLHLQRMAALIQKGEIGQPIMIWLNEMRGPFRVSPEHMWIFDREKSGGMLVEKSCHHFDLFNWFSLSSPVSVYASGGQDVFHELAGVKSSICDNAWVVVNYESGARAMLGLSMFLGRPNPREGGIGYHRRDIGVAGEHGLIQTEGTLPRRAIEIHPSTSRNVTRIQMDTSGAVPTPFNQEGNVGILMDFAACIREGREPFAGGKAGRDALAVSLAAEKSIEENRLVEIGEICSPQG